MSLRLRLSLVIAVIAALVAAGIGFAVYDRAEEERLDTARRSAADDVRARQSVAGVITAGEGQLPDTFVEGAPRGSGYNGGTRALGRRIPPELRERVQGNPGRVFTVVLREQPNPVIIAGTQLSSGVRVYAQRRFAQDEAALRDLRRSIIQIVIGAAILGAVVGALMAALITQPLRRSVALARRLAAGDLNARLKPKGQNEIAELGRALDDMADALGTKIAELDSAAERERRFSADVAHELRTPITGLVAAASLLDDSPEGRMVRERASALAALVEDLLEVMRLEGGTEEARVERFDLVRLVSDVARQRAPEALLDAPHALQVSSDPRRVERVLANLLDNAVRHGRPPVCIIVRRDGSVTVRDYGEGFGPFLEHAGERFAMASSSRGGGGTGLGLAIAHGQARILGGSLDLADADGAIATLHLFDLPPTGNGNGRP